MSCIDEDDDENLVAHLGGSPVGGAAAGNDGIATPITGIDDDDDGAVELPNDGNGGLDANVTSSGGGGIGDDALTTQDHYEGQLVDSITVSELKVWLPCVCTPCALPIKSNPFILSLSSHRESCATKAYRRAGRRGSWYPV